MSYGEVVIVSECTLVGKGCRERTLTAAGPWQLRQAQRGVVGGHGLERDVAVPLGAGLLLGADLVGRVLAVELLVLHGADGADLRVLAAELALRVEDGVNVQARSLGSAGELAEAQDKLFLQVIGEVVLGAEEDYPTLGDCKGKARLVSFEVFCGWLGQVKKNVNGERALLVYGRR